MTDDEFEAQVEAVFPGLAGCDWEHTSPYDDRYNCVAYAAGDSARFWWPLEVPNRAAGYYWPPSAPLSEDVPAFVAAFATLGYEPCSDGELEAGFEKVVIYAKRGTVTHMCRQLSDDAAWTSKLGKDIDIKHDNPAALTGPDYGEVAGFLRRPNDDSSS